MQRIQPRVLKGFRDILPEDEYKRRRLMRKLEEHFSLFGYRPIDTPALEYTEILLGKGGGETEKQIFRFEDQGGRDVALRFDLTVPFARFMATYGNSLPLPFKRYHIGKAWRGEKPQKGRYREFYQCDCDIVGVDSASADIEILSVMCESLEALGINRFQIHFSHRGLFNRFLEGIGNKESQEAVLRSVDKMRKVGMDTTLAELTELVGEAKAKDLCNWITPRGTFAETLENLETLTGGPSEESKRLREVYQGLQAMGLESSLLLDPSITRGLDYYTGVVFETFLLDLPNIGSIYSGGRYNNLAGLYTKQELPGVGCSIGLDRTIAALEQLDKETVATNELQVLVCMPEERELLPEAHTLARALRKEGIPGEVYHRTKKYGVQFKYAEERGFAYTLILSAPLADSTKESPALTLKDMKTRESITLSSLEETLSLLQSKQKTCAPSGAEG